ncbi:MAG: hypothetical protein ABSB70_12315, partial [Candidatus Velthaea sp.]
RYILRQYEEEAKMSVQTEAVCDIDDFEPLLGIEILFFDSLGETSLFKHITALQANNFAFPLFRFNGETGVAYFQFANGRPRTQFATPCTVFLDELGSFVGFEIPAWIGDYRFASTR